MKDAPGSIFKKPKTRKGKKFLENREPKIVENKKSAIFLRGLKTSETILAFLRDFAKIRGTMELNKPLLRKSHDIHPFDNAGPLELQGQKHDASIIAFGHH